MNKSKQMLQAEKRNGGLPLEELLPKLMNQHGLSGTADQLGISKATLNYWLLKFEIKIHKIALAPGQSVVIQNAPSMHPYNSPAPYPPQGAHRYPSYPEVSGA